MDALVALFTEALPGKHTREEVAALLTGSVAALERALTADTAPSIEDIIAAEARTGTAKLVRPPSLGLVEHVADDDDLPAVRLGEAFLIEYRTARRGFLFVLQHDAQQAWGAVLFASGEASLRHDAGPVLIPGIKDKRFVPIRERSHPGIHRFMLFVAPEPFPAGITKPARARTYFDWQTLGDLAAHFARQPKHLRELHLLTIRVEGGQDQSR
ncbi:hypothetical protein GN330_12155 [Nitratireductor sp. CAU 1489]|uniref:DUF4384 domain-containing protein n=1 Tax=Nitratireductor arenosus TaxID=2682096 RepID=A0A844QFX9_9HYPH|nr:hypothetical protein [Nitratireductor arenosus]MVA97997.1 hypothetical protein [Nitratireductor arenosus]